MYSWKKIPKEDFRPDYFDHAPAYYFQTAAFPGRIVFRGDDVSYEPDHRSLAMLKWFGVCFTLLLMLGSYLFAEDEIKWAIVAAVPAFAAITFGLWYYLLNREINSGAYIEYLVESDEIVLPQFDKRFAKDRVYLQEITGRSTNDPEAGTLLNLIVQEDDVRRRYFVKSAPMRKYVKQFAERAEVPVVEVNLGWGGFYDQDLSDLEELGKANKAPSACSKTD